MTTHKPGTREWAEEQARKGAKVRHERWGHDSWISFIDGLFHWREGAKNLSTTYLFPDHLHGGWSIHTPAPDDNPVTREEFDALAQLVTALERFLDQMVQTISRMSDTISNLTDRLVDRQFTTGLTAAQLPPGTKPWKPTPGRDAMTRGGKRAEWFARADGSDWPFQYLIDGQVHSFDRRGDSLSMIKLIADWPDPAPEFKTTRRMSDDEIVMAAMPAGEANGWRGVATEAIRLTRERIRADLEADVEAAGAEFWRVWKPEAGIDTNDALRAALRKHSEGV